jgi:hypothetical protein
MSIAAPVNQSQQIRNLGQKGLSIDDIHELTGFDKRLIKSALGRKPKDKVKSRRLVEARGPISAVEVSTITGMPLSAAKLMVK